MTKVIGVRFRTAGKVYFFDPLHFEIKRGDHVIVETARGIEYGTVVSGVHEVENDKVIQPLKPVIRTATQRDVEQEAANKIKEREAYKICLEKIRHHELEMKLIDAEYTFDNNKVLFYFTADGRIDFRELVKDLASVFKTRIELRQIGVRDETKIMGGIGICGRPLCCHSYLSDFVPVSIKMAKEQNLSLNPTKISGVCGRLMCCLKNEEETYEDLNRRLPGIGDAVTTDDGLKGEVQSVNVLRQIVKVIVDVDDEKEIRDYEVDRLQFKRRHNKKERIELSKEELKELERLEREEISEEADSRRDRRNSEGVQDKPDRFDRRNDNRQERNADRVADRGTDKNAVRIADRIADKNADRNSDKSTDKNCDKRNDNRQSNERRHDRNRDRNQDRALDKNVENRQDRASDRNGDKNIDRNSDRNVDRSSDKNSDRYSDRNIDRRNENRQENDRRRDRRIEHRDRRNNVGGQERSDRFDRRNNESKFEGQQDKRNDTHPQEVKNEAVNTVQEAQSEEQRREGRNNRFHRNRYRNRRDGRKPENHDNHSEG